MRALRFIAILPLLLPIAVPAAGQEEEAPAIEVNGFFVEEAYNQEAGMLQQIARVTQVRGGAWSGVFSQEWPLFSEAHQLELAARVAQHDGFAGLGAEYRYLLVGDEDATFALSPGVEAEWSREVAEDGEAEGEWELELMLPASVRLGETLVASTNLGIGFQPGADDDAVGFSAGQGLVWRAHPRLNLLVEAVWSRGESPFGEGDGEDDSVIVSPGVQLAFPLWDEVQVVPGIAVPLGVGPSSGERAILFYLSVEHPFGRRGR